MPPPCFQPTASPVVPPMQLQSQRPLAWAGRPDHCPCPSIGPMARNRCPGSAQHLYPWLVKVGEVQMAKMKQLILYTDSHTAPEVYHDNFDISFRDGTMHLHKMLGEKKLLTAWFMPSTHLVPGSPSTRSLSGRK